MRLLNMTSVKIKLLHISLYYLSRGTVILYLQILTDTNLKALYLFFRRMINTRVCQNLICKCELLVFCVVKAPIISFDVKHDL